MPLVCLLVNYPRHAANELVYLSAPGNNVVTTYGEQALRNLLCFTILNRERSCDLNESARIRIAHSKVSTKMSGAFSHTTEPDSNPIKSQFGSLVGSPLPLSRTMATTRFSLLTQHNPTAGGPRMPENIG